jgi:translation initiation factor IF-1
LKRPISAVFFGRPQARREVLGATTPTAPPQSKSKGPLARLALPKYSSWNQSYTPGKMPLGHGKGKIIPCAFAFLVAPYVELRITGGCVPSAEQKLFRGEEAAPYMTNEQAIELEGTIQTVLPGTMFRVTLDNQHEVLAHISGKMRKRFVRLTVGDRVRMEMSPYDLSKARITYRLR